MADAAMTIRAFSPVACVLVVAVACGGGNPPAKTARDTPEEQEQEGGGTPLDVSSEIGALDEDKVNEAFSGSIKELQRCLDQGSRRIEFIGGGVSFYVKVDGSGRLSHAHLEQTSLGDRETEKCMLGVLRGKSWPAPVGGDAGYARKSFDFDPPNDVRPPEEWSSDRVVESLAKKSDEIAKCKNGSSGEFTVTMYVSADGDALGVGIAPPDEAGEAAVDCLVDVIKGAKYPDPGGWAAKVTFTL
jgi:hypothetical protein